MEPVRVTKALVDCPDHEQARGGAALVENVLSYGNPARTTIPPGGRRSRTGRRRKSLTHEQSYYKWLERSWRAGSGCS